jgi:transcriptional regulator with XRE-family HTH domain
MQPLSYNFEIRGYDPVMPAGRPAIKKPTDFGERLGAARRAAGLTQQELGDRIGVTQRVVAYWERESVGLKADQLVSLAEALGVSVDELLGRRGVAKRRGGPVGRARKLFEDISTLPRGRQQRVLDMIETFLAGQAARNGD